MLFHRARAVAAVFAAFLLSAGANAFETTSIGGTNADGSAKFQDPDELGSALTPSTGSGTSSSPFGNFNFSAGVTPNGSDRSTNWLNSQGSPGSFGFTGSQSTSSAEPSSPFNTPILRDRN